LEDLLVMKKTISFLSICATLALLSLPAFANRTQLTFGAPAQDQCTAEKKSQYYKDFVANFKGDQAKAYEAGKKYLGCPADTNDAEDAQRTAYVQKWVTAYEKLHSKDPLTNALNKKDYPAAFEAAKKVFADEPNYLNGYMDLAIAGALSGNQALADDSINYAKKAIELIEAGKTPEGATGFSKDDALAKLNYSIGLLLKQKQQNSEAIPYFIRVASYNSKLKSTPQTYSNLAEAYEHGPYAKQSADYKACCEGKAETDQSKLMIENINQIVDRMVDAYARAVASAGSDPGKADWMSSLTVWYKYRHNDSDNGLSEMIAGILSKPLPPVPTPITSLPTPPATPASGPGSSGATTAAGANTGTATPAQPKPATPPTARTTKPKTRRAHAAH
jgi:tetratricopeptide (TPR) repeat protein